MTIQHRHRLYHRLLNVTHRPRAKANYLLRAKRANGRGIHSPYLFRFVTMVLNTKWPYYAFEALEVSHLEEKKHSLIKLNRKKPHRVEQLIFRIVQDHQPATMLEIGHREGIEIEYLLHACPKATCKRLTYAPDAKDDESLKDILSQMEKLDFVLFNAPAERPLRMYEFRSCIQKAHEGSLFVINHIHQSPEQALNWKMMRNHPEVRASIDLYSIGILFFRSDLPKCKLRIKL